MSKEALAPLSPNEAQAARDFFAGRDDALHAFVGWMVSSGKFSGKIAEEIRTFTKIHGGGVRP